MDTSTAISLANRFCGYIGGKKPSELADEFPLVQQVLLDSEYQLSSRISDIARILPSVVSF